MDWIYNADVSVGNNAVVDLFGQTVSDTLDEDLTPAYSIKLQNTGGTDLYVGAESGSLSSVGWIVPVDGTLDFDFPSRRRIYATFGSGHTGSVRVLIILK